jgi:hypothetical protein
MRDLRFAPTGRGRRAEDRCQKTEGGKGIQMSEVRYQKTEIENRKQEIEDTPVK